MAGTSGNSFSGSYRVQLQTLSEQEGTKVFLKIEFLEAMDTSQPLFVLLLSENKFHLRKEAWQASGMK